LLLILILFIVLILNVENEKIYLKNLFIVLFVSLLLLNILGLTPFC